MNDEIKEFNNRKYLEDDFYKYYNNTLENIFYDDDLYNVESYIKVVNDILDGTINYKVNKEKETNNLTITYNKIIDGYINNNLDTTLANQFLYACDKIREKYNSEYYNKLLQIVKDKKDKLSDYDAINLYVCEKLDCSYEKFMSDINLYKSSKFYDSNKEIIDKLSNLKNILAKEDFISEIEKIGINNIQALNSDYTIYAERTYMDTKKASEYPLLKEQEGITIREASNDFKMLISVVRKRATLSNTKINMDSYLDEYDKHNNLDNQSYQSLSLISDNYLGIFTDKEDINYIFGYQGYDPGFIVGASPYDNWSSLSNHMIKQMNDLKYDADALLRNSYSSYNEATAYRRNEITNQVLLPTCIICFDEVDQNTLDAAKKFNAIRKTDIIVINRKKIFDKIKQDINNKINNIKTIDDRINCMKDIEKVINTLSIYNKDNDELQLKNEFLNQYNILYDQLIIELTNTKNNIFNMPNNTFIDKYKRYIEFTKLNNKIQLLNINYEEARRCGNSNIFNTDVKYKLDNIIFNEEENYIYPDLKDDLLKSYDDFNNLSKQDIDYIISTYDDVFDVSLKSKLSDLYTYCYKIQKNNKDTYEYINTDSTIYKFGDTYIIIKDNKLIDIKNNENITIKNILFSKNKKYIIDGHSFIVKADNTVEFKEDLSSFITTLPELNKSNNLDISTIKEEYKEYIDKSKADMSLNDELTLDQQELENTEKKHK